jgi:hypothetical protein
MFIQHVAPPPSSYVCSTGSVGDSPAVCQGIARSKGCGAWQAPARQGAPTQQKGVDGATALVLPVFFVADSRAKQTPHACHTVLCRSQPHTHTHTQTAKSKARPKGGATWGRAKQTDLDNPVPETETLLT